MGKPISNVTIVGGGTAGWMTAVLLDAFARSNSDGKRSMKISLIESPNIPTVGVGEATVPGMPMTLRKVGISEQQFFKTCNASFKLGVMFDNWNNDAKGKPISYVNPFARAPMIDQIDAGYFFQEYGAGGLDFVQSFSPSVDLGAACKGPRPLGGKEYDSTVGYAYHLDAGRFAGMLKEVCIARGVEHILDDMLEVKQDERGFITGLELKDRGHHPIELVIDCTGFRGLIINEALKEPFVSYSKYLANDRAMAVQIPHPDEKIEPMTHASALGAGWSWRVPLFNRIGTGYVYSSAHRTDEEAREEFVKHLGVKDAEPRVIPMRVGRNQNAWVKNCVAIGLSGGFIEPLESTAIHMIDAGVKWLINLFPDSDFADPLRKRYNTLTGKLYDEVRDFICLHYALGNRTDDEYWIDARSQLEVPDSLAENLELWKYKLPATFDLGFASLFSSATYTTVLLGKRVYETGYGEGTFDSGGALDAARWKTYLARSRKRTEGIVKATADHRTLLTELRGELVPPAEPWALQSGNPTVPLPGMAPQARAIVKLPEFRANDEAGLL
ncbi:tryptophan halogenase family protein [Aliiroseovarius sp. YM-037]|uniref:tryptophan halogenase family protein n=1 Tax=Aliiroseovarius sp. YM-037 TaxID=3341728 RepID=UPI003A7F7A46